MIAALLRWPGDVTNWSLLFVEDPTKTRPAVSEFLVLSLRHNLLPKTENYSSHTRHGKYKSLAATRSQGHVCTHFNLRLRYCPCLSLHQSQSQQFKQNMSSQPTSQQQASTNYKEAFQLFDKRGTGRVHRDSLGDLLRACGQNPTLAEIADLEKSLGSPECMLSPLRKSPPGRC